MKNFDLCDTGIECGTPSYNRSKGRFLAIRPPQMFPVKEMATTFFSKTPQYILLCTVIYEITRSYAIKTRFSSVFHFINTSNSDEIQHKICLIFEETTMSCWMTECMGMVIKTVDKLMFPMQHYYFSLR